MTLQPDEAKLNDLLGKMLGDLGGAFDAPLVRLGLSLGLWKALHEKGPMTPAALAAETGCDPRYIREWLSAQAASGYVAYDEPQASFALSPEQAMVFAIPDSPVYLIGAFDAAAAMLENQPLVEKAFRSGDRCNLPLPCRLGLSAAGNDISLRPT